jgi:hypothetical protein
MVAMADSGVVVPPSRSSAAALPSEAGVASGSGMASRITRYWLVSVKMVETMRWPKAL